VATLRDERDAATRSLGATQRQLAAAQSEHAQSVAVGVQLRDENAALATQIADARVRDIDLRRALDAATARAIDAERAVATVKKKFFFFFFFFFFLFFERSSPLLSVSCRFFIRHRTH
jgi:hypothetical protein